MAKNDLTNKISSTKDISRGWGTYLDKLNTKIVPTKYSGLSFHEADHQLIERFEKLSDLEKWEMGFWAESQATRYGFISGFWLGLILAIFAALALLSI